MTPSQLYRLTSFVGLTCTAILVFNSARKGGLVPDITLTRAVAPLGALTGLFALTGIYLWQRAETGVLGLVGYALNAAGLAGAFAIEYTLQYVFAYLPKGEVTALVDGAPGKAFTVTAVVLIAGALTFGAAMWRARRFPPAAVALYAIGMVPGSLRNVVPVGVYLAGLLAAAAGVAWLSLTLLRQRKVSPVFAE
ncbi:MAG: hypothetical protein AUI14_23670 [Actinobacteria bacterium 13_2_20CM_2_71_6]|nr:MAG: hypothetical protein AUI14_23670 [Actinobacteria bacterium 13_2_20CM_2_71_6]